MDYLLIIGTVASAWVLLRHLGNERETQVRLIEIRVRRDFEEQAILQKIEEERAGQKQAAEISQ
jgi:phage terminase large subunit-like protein